MDSTRTAIPLKINPNSRLVFTRVVLLRVKSRSAGMAARTLEDAAASACPSELRFFYLSHSCDVKDKRSSATLNWQFSLCHVCDCGPVGGCNGGRVDFQRAVMS